MVVINWLIEILYLLVMIFNDLLVCIVWDDVELVCGEVFDVFCVLFLFIEIIWLGNIKLLFNWLFCLIFFIEVLYFWVIFYNDLLDCIVCCVEVCVLWCVKNVVVLDVVVIVNVNFFKGIFF